jgi:hypothetical protein
VLTFWHAVRDLIGVVRQQLNTWTFGIVLTGASLAGAVTPVEACSCVANGTPCQAIGSDTTVFVGTVISRDAAGGPEVSPAGAIAAVQTGASEVRYRIAVTEVLNGTVPAAGVTEVTTMANIEACGYQFHVGGTYLIYARGDANHLTTSICSRTTVAAAADEELALMRETRRGRPESRIMGSVVLLQTQLNGFYPMPRPVAAAPDFVVTATGASGVRRQTRTDDSGAFVFRDLAPGDYVVMPTLPDGMYVFPRDVKAVTLGSCSAEHFLPITYTGISGTIASARGSNSREQIGVTIVEADADGRPRGKDHSAVVYSDHQGRWEIPGLVYGRYVVGVNVYSGPSDGTPYGPFWVTTPGEPTEPRVFTVSDDRPVIDIQLPEPLPRVSLTGRVVDAEGKGVAAEVLLFDAEDSTQSVATVTAGEDGRFSIQGFAGRQYRIGAHIVRRFSARGEAPAVDVPPTSADQPITLVLQPMAPR